MKLNEFSWIKLKPTPDAGYGTQFICGCVNTFGVLSGIWLVAYVIGLGIRLGLNL